MKNQQSNEHLSPNLQHHLSYIHRLSSSGYGRDNESSSNLMGMTSSYIHHLSANDDQHGHHHAATGLAHVDHQYDDDDDDDCILAKHLRNTATKEYTMGRERYQGGAGASGKQRQSESSRTSSHHSRSQHSRTSSKNRTSGTTTTTNASKSSNTIRCRVSSLEEDYTQAMNRMSRAGDYYYYDPQQQQDNLSRKQSSSTYNSKSSHNRSTSSKNGQPETSTATTALAIKKKEVSTLDPSEETIAIFGAYGVTGHHFLQLAMEAGYKVRALVLPGIEMEDVNVVGNDNIRLITGSFDEEEKVRKVVKNASYVVCLLNDCDRTLVEQQKKQQQNANTCSVGNLENLPPIINGGIVVGGGGDDDAKSNNHNTNSNLQFIQKLLPILEELDTCRVLLYQASSVAQNDKGATPIFGKVVKNLAVRKNWRDTLREQDRIVKYIVNHTKEMSINFIITRPNTDNMIWDRPSRKKLAASKSQPGPFPITNIDLAEFTLGALKMEKLYNTCPYVVQDGI